MSLLIKALEQAAKDRDSAKAAGDAASTPAPAKAAEPTLEPPPPPRPIPSLDAGPRERSAADEAPAFARGRPTLDPTTEAPKPAAPAPRVEPAAPPRARPASAFDGLEVKTAAPAPRAAPAAPIARKPATPGEPAAAPAPRPAAGAPTAGASAVRQPAAAAASARRTQQTAVSLEDIDAQEQRARAATVMQASGGAASNALTYLRSNPVAMIGALALLCGFGYGVYVYLQISNPSLFIRQAAKQPDPAPPAPPPAAPAPSPAATAPASDPMAGMAPPAAAPAPTAAAAPASMPESPAPASGAISASSVIGPRAGDSPRPPETQRLSERDAPPPRDRGSVGAGEARPASVAPAAAPARAATAPAAQPAADAPASRERIAVSPVAAQPRLNPALAEGYSSLQNGDLESARSSYGRALQSEPQNVDAMLGLAYVAAQENRTEDAMRFYTRILQLNPRHPQAQAAMIGLVGRADPIASETRLKQLIAREPSPFLHFVLGNLYADQSLWAQAQQSYFQAHHLEPSNPDYAYNLAVGLDHLGQGKLALNFYRLADKLASAGRANFNVAHARERISSLSSQLD